MKLNNKRNITKIGRYFEIFTIKQKLSSRSEVPCFNGVSGSAVEDGSGGVEGKVSDERLSGRTSDLSGNAVDVDVTRVHLTSRSVRAKTSHQYMINCDHFLGFVIC